MLLFSTLVTGSARSALLLHFGVEIKNVQHVARNSSPNVPCDQIQTLMHWSTRSIQTVTTTMLTRNMFLLHDSATLPIQELYLLRGWSLSVRGLQLQRDCTMRLLVEICQLRNIPF